MNEYKTIDQLLNENSNLLFAVSILIEGCLNKDRSAIYEWDKIRRIDEDKTGIKL